MIKPPGIKLTETPDSFGDHVDRLNLGELDNSRPRACICPDLKPKLGWEVWEEVEDRVVAFRGTTSLLVGSEQLLYWACAVPKFRHGVTQTLVGNLKSTCAFLIPHAGDGI